MHGITSSVKSITGSTASCPSILAIMIIRLFRALVKPGAAAEYQTLLEQKALPFFRSKAGLVSLHLGCPIPEEPDQFIIMTVWHDLQSIKAFTGDKWQAAIIAAGEAHLLREVSVQHFDLASQ